MSLAKDFLIFAKDPSDDLRKIRKPRIQLESANTTHINVDMSWYDAWLSQQLKNLPHSLMQLRVGAYKLQEQASLNVLFEAVEKCALRTEGVSIDEITPYF